MKTTHLTLLGFFLFTSASICHAIEPADWPQFRGHNAAGVSQGDAALPGEIDMERHLVWKSVIGHGHSSPVIVGDRVYLTALDGKRLLTMALEAETGKVAWQAEAEYERLEKVHRIGSRATPSVAADGDVVVSFFGSSGLHAYDSAGKLLWKNAMGPFDNGHGAASSPILVEDTIVIIQDHDTGSFLAAYNKRTGEQKWRVDRPEFRRNYCTPVVWQQGGTRQIVIAGTAQVNAYDWKSGEHVWAVLRGSRVISATPVIGGDGRLYVVNSGGGEAPDQPSFASLLKSSDANKNGQMEKDELPDSIIRRFLEQFDRDKDGSLSEVEYESIRRTMAYASPIAMAIEPGGQGDITNSHVAWASSRSIPRNASPLLVGGNLFMLKDGGILSVLNAKSGEELNSGRLKATGKFYSSPVSGDGKIYAISEEGKLNVITAEPEWKQLATVDLGEDAFATPAIAHGKLYVRTAKHLWCFAMQE